MELSLVKIYKICQDPETLHQKLVEWKLVPPEGALKCKKCKAPMKLGRDVSKVDGWRYRCRRMVSLNKQKRKPCVATMEYRKGTFFVGAHLSIEQILCFVYCWVHCYPLTATKLELEPVSYATMRKWESFCRQVLIETFLEKAEKLGGPGVLVEIDETKFGDRELHKGQTVEGQWVFGGFERGSGRVFMVPIEDRNADTLMSVIKQWILPGTTIISDCWEGYDGLQQAGYEHLKVNQSVNFVDPETGAHINSIESTWRHVKGSISTSDRRYIAGNLACYMFKKKCKALKADATIEFFHLAGQLYDQTKEGSVERDSLRMEQCDVSELSDEEDIAF